MKNNIELKQETKLQQRVIPMQMQLGKLLEMNDHALNELISSTVEENPALVKLDHEDESFFNRYKEKDETQNYEENENDNSYSDNLSNYKSGKSILLESYGNNLHQETLTEHLELQLLSEQLTPKVEAFAKYIIGNLDSRGYLTRPLEDLRSDYIVNEGEKISLKQSEEALSIVRSLEPCGVGASNIQDCLIMQLDNNFKNNDLVVDAENIIINHFDTLLQDDRKKLSKETGMSIDQVNKVVNLISKLTPSPGKEFANTYEEDIKDYIHPDFAILPDIDNPGNLIITNFSNIPELSIEENFTVDKMDNYDSFSSSLNKSNRNAALFLKNRREEAQNFIDLVKMRQNTLLRIIKAIAKIQKNFLLTGEFLQLKPMVLKDIMAITGDDLSVISRATSNRFILTTAGIISLKSLFNETKSTNSDENITSIHIENAIKQIIDTENPQKPLADEDITKELKDKGFNIARRTVAKYRETLGIPIARKRKIQK